eukprot:COSAG06_NODE_36930_length_441_cov_1.020468_1_plen_124_part_01
MAGWSMLKQVELRALLSALGQPTDGGKAALVQRVATFMSDDLEAAAATRPADDDEGGGGPSASEAAELRAAGMITALNAWQAAMSHLHELTTSLAQQRAQARAAEAQAKVVCVQQRATLKVAAA